MNVCSNEEELERFLQLAANVSKKHPVVVSRFLQHAKEVEMDAVARDGEIIAYAISEHIEFAGVHSGDATIQFPPQKLYVETARRIKKISKKIAAELHISGPFNIQFLARENDIKVIECNLRASRSFPFVSKVLKINLIDLATRIMLGLPVEKPAKSLFDLDYVGVKASQFSFSRLQKADPVLGVDMASTGEVGCLGEDARSALLKSMIAVGHKIPAKNILLSTGDGKRKAEMLEASKILVEHGYRLFATDGTSRYLTENGIENTRVYWPTEEGQPQALDMLHNRELDMVVNIPKNLTAGELTNGYKIRDAAICAFSVSMTLAISPPDATSSIFCIAPFSLAENMKFMSSAPSFSRLSLCVMVTLNLTFAMPSSFSILTVSCSAFCAPAFLLSVSAAAFSSAVFLSLSSLFSSSFISSSPVSSRFTFSSISACLASRSLVLSRVY